MGAVPYKISADIGASSRFFLCVCFLQKSFVNRSQRISNKSLVSIRQYNFVLGRQNAYLSFLLAWDYLKLFFKIWFLKPLQLIFNDNFLAHITNPLNNHSIIGIRLILSAQNCFSQFIEKFRFRNSVSTIVCGSISNRREHKKIQFTFDI